MSGLNARSTVRTIISEDICHPFENLQLDTMYLTKNAGLGVGIAPYALIVIDMFTTLYGFSFMKRITPRNAFMALQRVLDTSPWREHQAYIHSMYMDRGNEFNREFEQLVVHMLPKVKVHHTGSFTMHKAFGAERAIRSIRELVAKMRAHDRSTPIAKLLQRAVHTHNNTPIAILDNKSPIEVLNPQEWNDVLTNRLQKHNDNIVRSGGYTRPPKYRVGDAVHVRSEFVPLAPDQFGQSRKTQHQFAKTSAARFSNITYYVSSIIYGSEQPLYSYSLVHLDDNGYIDQVLAGNASEDKLRPSAHSQLTDQTSRDNFEEQLKQLL